MKDTTKVVKCPICGGPYIIFSFLKTDQTSCRKCRAKALVDLASSISKIPEQLSTPCSRCKGSGIEPKNCGLTKIKEKK